MSGLNIDDDVVGYKHDPALTQPRNEKHDAMLSSPGYAVSASTDDGFPTDEELATLPRIPDKVPWKAFPIAFVELCERFSYYGTTVVFVNFLQQPPPPGSTTGAGGTNRQAGALGKGQRVSTGLNTFNNFWVYVIPLFGAYIADTYWGRYKTISIALALAIFGHILLVMSALPSVIANPNGAMGCFIIAIIIMGMGTGAFKANISPLVAEQYRTIKMRVVTEQSGRRVIIDPALTISRIYQYFYLMINIGALVGQISMVYAEKYVGFWLSFTLPTIALCLCPYVLWWGRNRYVRSPPQGSVLSKALHVWVYAMKGRWSINPVTTFKNMNDGTMWEKVKPSTIAPADRPRWMTFDDVWVDEVRRGFKACSVFLWYPLYWLTYNQIIANLTSQAAEMALHGVPNDIVNNLDPFALIILIPICDLFIYPAIRRTGFDLSPIKKITGGFFMGSLAMIWACIIQVYIYRQSPCGHSASTCVDKDGNQITVGINVWAQTGAYVLIAISEILASITGLEYAFTKAPKNMRSLVMSAFLFMSAISSAIGEAFVSLSADPLLVWNYGAMAVISFLAGIGFWLQYRHLDRQEDVLNAIGEGNLHAGGKDEEHLSGIPDPSKAGEHPARQTVDDVKL